MELLEEIKSLIEPLLREKNLELFDISFNQQTLKIFIDKIDTAVSIDECEQISKEIEKLLDEKNLIKHSYVLEVSSPGLDRPLRGLQDFVRFQQKSVKIILVKPQETQGTFIRGKIRGVKNDLVIIENEKGKVLEIPFNNIIKANLEVEF